MLTLLLVLVLLALVLTIAVASGRTSIPLWVPVLILCLVELARVFP